MCLCECAGVPAFNGKCVDKSRKARSACRRGEADADADAEPRLAWKLFLIAAI